MAKNTNSSEGTAKRLANLKNFKKGQSGNPAGRPKGSKSAKTRALEMLTALSEDKEPMTPIFKLMLDVLQGEDEQTKDRLKAADMLMDRIDGKAIARVEQKTEDVTPAKLDNLSDKDLKEMARIQKKLEE